MYCPYIMNLKYLSVPSNTKVSVQLILINKILNKILYKILYKTLYKNFEIGL